MKQQNESVNMFDLSRRCCRAPYSQIRSADSLQGGRRKGACLGRHMTTAWKYLIQLRHIYIMKQPSIRSNGLKNTQVRRDLARIPASQHGPAWMVHLPQMSLSKYHCSRIHPHKHPITRAEHSLWGLAGVDTVGEHDCHYHTSGPRFIGAITSPQP